MLRGLGEDPDDDDLLKMVRCTPRLAPPALQHVVPLPAAGRRKPSSPCRSTDRRASLAVVNRWSTCLAEQCAEVEVKDVNRIGSMEFLIMMAKKMFITHRSFRAPHLAHCIAARRAGEAGCAHSERVAFGWLCCSSETANTHTHHRLTMTRSTFCRGARSDRSEDELVQAFKVFDEDDNGFITKQELTSVYTSLGTDILSRSELDDLMKTADTGTVSWRRTRAGAWPCPAALPRHLANATVS